MRRFITTEKKRTTLNKLWREYDTHVRARGRLHATAPEHAGQRATLDSEIRELRQNIEDFVYDNGGTLE